MKYPRRLSSTQAARAQNSGELVMAATIGEQLRLAREERGIPLREISDQTRISVRYLEAIEHDDFKRLPGGIFNRSFVRAYARYVGYDEKEAIEAYTHFIRELGESGDDIPTTPLHSKVYTDAPATRSPILTVVLTIVILAILTAAALAVLNWFQKRSAELRPTGSSVYQIVACNNKCVAAEEISGSSNIWKADYEQVWQ